MKQKQSMSSISFGLVYFIMFAIAFGIDQQERVIMYPKIGSNFWFLMIKDSLIGIGLGLVVVVISQVLTRNSSSLQDLGAEFYKVIGGLKKEEIFFLAFFSSVGEEFLFRGIIQSYAGVVIASILFGALHIAPGKSGRAWSMFAMIMGFVMGLEYMWLENIFAPIWTHFVVNFLNIYLLQRQMSKKEQNLSS